MTLRTCTIVTQYLNECQKAGMLLKGDVLAWFLPGVLVWVGSRSGCSHEDQLRDLTDDLKAVFHMVLQMFVGSQGKGGAGEAGGWGHGKFIWLGYPSLLGCACSVSQSLIPVDPGMCDQLLSPAVSPVFDPATLSVTSS